MSNRIYRKGKSKQFMKDQVLKCQVCQLQNDFDPTLIGQAQALKTKDFGMYKQLQKKQIEFNIDDYSFSDEDKVDEKIEEYETQSFIDEIQS